MGKWKTTYEKGRKYRKEWEKENPWLTCHNNQAFCTACCCILLNRSSSIDVHKKTAKHSMRIACQESGSAEAAGIQNLYDNSWEEHFPWLTAIDGLCFCKLCNSTILNRKTSLVAHEKTLKHKKAAATEVGESPQFDGEALPSLPSRCDTLPRNDDCGDNQGQANYSLVRCKEEPVVVSFRHPDYRRIQKIKFTIMPALTSRIGCMIKAEEALAKAVGYDGIIVVSDSLDKLNGPYESFLAPLKAQLEIDDSVSKDGTCVKYDGPGGRLVYAPTGPLDRDYDDVRRIADAAGAGIKRAIKAGMKRPLLVNATSEEDFQHNALISLLGALHALYVPLEIREDVPAKSKKLNELGFLGSAKIIELALALESGRAVARDIGGSDPERMAPPKVEEYVKSVFQGSNVKVEVVSNDDKLCEEYPLFSAVNRCAKGVNRHKGRILYLTYEGEGPIEKTLMLVGKGVTYDTGGADIKAGGVMAGMHRDKCGAAAVAGFMEIVNRLKPKNLKVISGMAMVRNSVGSECYVADEIITSRAGVRVRVGNTDAEGRMAMADVLCRMKELALQETDPHLMTIATLTGHCVLAYGESYSAIMDNGPARLAGVAQFMQICGDEVADPFEISSIRREDFEFHAGKSEYEDVLQCNNAPSSRTPRGHQTPSAFLILSSGLDKHGKDSAEPLKYSHLDIAGSSGPFPGIPTGAPILALARAFIPNAFDD